jgi:hypothetical protein
MTHADLVVLSAGIVVYVLGVLAAREPCRRLILDGTIHLPRTRWDESAAETEHTLRRTDLPDHRRASLEGSLSYYRVGSEAVQEAYTHRVREERLTLAAVAALTWPLSWVYLVYRWVRQSIALTPKGP